WSALRPLIENSLAERGSLFLVGDTKQSIFTFRGADWRIMARMLQEEEFPSVRCARRSLTMNYRSTGAILDFVKDVFHNVVPNKIPPEITVRSGLATFEQEVK